MAERETNRHRHTPYRGVMVDGSLGRRRNQALSPTGDFIPNRVQVTEEDIDGSSMF